MIIVITFDSHIFPDLASGNPVTLHPGPLTMSLLFLSTFLLFGIRGSILILCFPGLSPEIHHFFKNPGFFKSPIKDLGSGCVHCYCECRCF